MEFAVVAEDELSSVLCRELIARTRPGAEFFAVYVLNGSAAIKKKIAAFNNAARAVRYVILTDLDQAPCAPDLVQDWCSGFALQPWLCLRVAVHEIEAWILADRVRFAALLGVSTNRIAAYPDTLLDPKNEIIRLARTSPKRDVRRALVPKGSAKQGPEHNSFLGDFVTSTWSLDAASAASTSLQRAQRAISSL